MLTNQQIHNLVTSPKRILRKVPAVGYQHENRQRRGDLQLEAVADSNYRFSVFIRQNTQFIENFSIGLRYQTGDSLMGTIILIRYNGPHGESSKQPDGHFGKSHIHRITEEALGSGSAHPQETDREITDLYATFEEALALFLSNIGVTNPEDYFPRFLQGRLFNGHS